MEAIGHKLFQLGDPEGKGFIIRRDMQKLKDELCMSPEQLEVVFDTLDIEQKGYITLNQFLERFKVLIEAFSPEVPELSPPAQKNKNVVDDKSSSIELSIETKKDDTSTISTQNYLWKENTVTFKLSFSDDIPTLLQNIKEMNILKLSLGHLETICNAAQPETDNSVIVGRIEVFLRNLHIDLTKIAEKHQELEDLLQSREVQHQNNIQKLFEELESHFREEQEKTKIEDQKKFKTELTALENEISDKDERLRATVLTRQELASQLVVAQKRELALLNENAELNKKQKSLEKELDAEKLKNNKLEELLEKTKVESSVSKEKHFKQGFFIAKNLITFKEEGPGVNL
ncbi:EF-hand calcium-binding domain-containing protein 4A-like isoform X2 [Daktulosphaira vitifoliae]|uniref:EF-hand calcium-binding domain-containing protein 4A-like isoform X2 n=1 Tax=Daktulosphaira vitifoliae TaxID=58002 RepID=UPI0021AA73E1|nr:EF-hand calcium-binding domain-containing protein 4A-like isoform X2 [Daktulosphaira vitifoliae]